ncbi:S8 family serine peptidase [Pontibacter sp. HSC-14F20]|uniref:S8 family serine peptidase n=1 Tax=Pontibacter sp. HSC-14F20 TaxID=2864136 RepID=UPI001C73C879|nr:S8 family serine peptidase [Pontibacter sp. HSC-14F20]MBX0332027.1 S8 family serine peptidase [Pontibacter sp. HSC-14F20]
MMNNSTLFKALSGLALASVLTLSSCQKEDFMEEQFQTDAAQFNAQHGQAIPDQYIVVFKNGSSNLSSTGVSAMTIAGRAAVVSLRERMMLASGIEREAIKQTFEGNVNGFAARLTKNQLDQLRKNPEVAYVEQDRIIMLANSANENSMTRGNSGKTKEPNMNASTNGNGKTKDGNTDTDTKGKGNGNGNGNGKKNTTEPNPVDPTPSEPVPTEPAPTEPTPTQPTPTEPAPVEPTPTEPAPVEPTPTEPLPTEPTPTEPSPAPEQPGSSSYTKITPLAGETLPWNIEMNGYGDGTGKTVWIIDSGIDTDHPDLNVDFQRSASLIYGDASIEDGFGHGTKVAGIIAAKNNGSGVVGVAADANIVALRVFDNTGYGTVSRAISAVNYVINMAKPGDVVNMSLGSGISSTLDNAVTTAAGRGILFAIAAGNSATDCSVNSPARVNAPGVYTVSAMDQYQNFWSSSNYGAPVDYAAPGVNISSTRIGGGFGSAGSGTSLAAPHVAGILLLRGEVFSQGIVNGDKDSWPDSIASIE